MRYKIWDREEKINNVEAEYIIKSLNIRETDNVFLIIDHLDEVQCIEIDRIIKSVYELDANLTVDEVAQEYIRIKEEEKLQAQSEVNTLEEQAERIAMLEKELSQLKASVAIMESKLLNI